jgi:uncharacterized integral membrane protein
MKPKPRTIVLIVIIVLFLIILIQNSRTTPINLLLWEVAQLPLFLLIIVVMLVGFVLGWFGHVAYNRGKQKGKITAPAETAAVKPEQRGKAGDLNKTDESS